MSTKRIENYKKIADVNIVSRFVVECQYCINKYFTIQTFKYFKITFGANFT